MCELPPPELIIKENELELHSTDNRAQHAAYNETLYIVQTDQRIRCWQSSRLPDYMRQFLKKQTPWYEGRVKIKNYETSVKIYRVKTTPIELVRKLQKAVDKDDTYKKFVAFLEAAVENGCLEEAVKMLLS